MRTGALAVCLLVASCGDSVAPILCDGGRCGTQTSWRKNYSLSLNRNVDILFVVDDTSAIAPHAGALATGFADMAQALQNLPQGPPSLHVGVVGAGNCPAGNRGLACGLAAPEQYLRSEWCATTTNFPGAFTDAFTCLPRLGAPDCAPAQPLAAAVQALTGPGRAGWDGFLRPDAYLMIVVVAAEDDASGSPGSPTPVAELAAAVRQLKVDPSQILISAIVPASCATAGASTPRLAAFVTAFGANSVLVDLCGGSLAAALTRLGDNLAASIDPPCALNVRDTDPVTAGLQASCSVEDHVIGRDGSLTTSWLPGCDVASPPCWRVLPSGSGCGAGTAFAIDRGPAWCNEGSTYGTIECLGCADANDPACATTR